MHARSVSSWQHNAYLLCCLQVQVTDRPLTAFSMQASQAPRLCGVGSADSSVTILQLSEGLVEMQHNEKNIISSVCWAGSSAFLPYHSWQAMSWAGLHASACCCTMRLARRLHLPAVRLSSNRLLLPACPPTLQMFEREFNREKNLEKNAKEAKAKARKEAAKTGEPLDRVTDDDLLQVGGVICARPARLEMANCSALVPVPVSLHHRPG